MGGVKHNIEATAVGNLTHQIHGVGLGRIDGLNAHGLHKLTARLVYLRDYDPAGTPGTGKDGDVQTHGSAAGNKHGVTLLDLAGHHHVVAHGKGLGEDGHVVRHIVGHSHQLVNAHLGVLGKAAVHMDAQQLQILAHMAQATLAGGTVTAGDDGVHQDSLTHLEGAGVALGQGLYGAQYLMAQDGGHGGSHVLAPVDNNVGAADTGQLHLDEGLVLAGHRHGYIAKLQVQPIFQNCCFHFIFS